MNKPKKINKQKIVNKINKAIDLLENLRDEFEPEETYEHSIV